MSSEERRVGKHRLTVDRRESVAVTGVLDVISFDEDQVICETDLGVLILRGSNLHVSSLNLENATLNLFGEIVSINYEDGRAGDGSGKKSTMLGRIFK
jgi:sporulation protein YabP